MRNSSKIIIITLFLVSFGLASLIYSSSLNEIPEGKLYEINIGMHAKDLQGNKIEPLYIQPFTFNYDFSNQRGNISFRVTKDLTFYSASIHFPTYVKNETFRVFHLKGDRRIKINKTIEYGGIYPYVDFSDHDNLILNKGDGILIDFESELVPKARFNFIIDKDLILYSDGSPGAETGNINLIIGNDYQCITPCLYGFNNIQERYNSFDGNLKLYWNTGNQNNAFYINTFSRWIIFKKNIFFSIGVAFIVSAVIELFLTLIPLHSRKETTFKGKIKGIRKKKLNRIKKQIK